MCCKIAHQHTKPYHFLKHFPTEIYVCAINRSQPGVPGPLGLRNKIFGGPKYDLRMKVCTFLDVCFFKRNTILKRLQSALLPQKTLSSPIIPADVSDLTMEIAKHVHCYLRFTLRLPR